MPTPLHKRHIPRRARTTPTTPALLLLAVLLAIFTDLPALGAPVQAAPDAGASALTPRPEAAMAAYRLVEQAVRTWTPMPESPEGEWAELAAKLGTVAGFHVQVRLDGRVVARPAILAVSMPGDGDARAAQAYEMLRRCVRTAMLEAGSRMDVPNDALREENLRERARGLRISVEVAGLPVPLQARTWSEAVVELEPGIHGVAVLRRSDRTVAPVFPSGMLSTGGLPSRTLSGVIAAVIGEGGAAAALDQPATIATQHQLTLLRFRTSHVADPGAGAISAADPAAARAAFLTRGARLVRVDEVRLDALRTWADRAAEHLLLRLEPHAPDGAAASDLRPWVIPGTPAEPAETHELALAALALTNYAALDGADQRVAARSRVAAQRVLRDCRKDLGNPIDPSRVVDAAMVMAAMGESVAEPANQSEDESVDAFLRGWDALTDGIFAAARGFDPQIPPPVRGLVAEAMAKRAAALRDPERLTQADAAITAAFASASPDQLVALMPWLARASAVVAGASHGDAARPSSLPSAVALRDMRERVWQNQLQIADAGETAQDLVGGIVFTSTSGSPLPTWQCFRPVVALARALRDERLTDEQEQARETARLGLALRFVRQLQTDEWSAWSAQSARQVVGGFRASAWDHSMPIDATSLGLLALSESVRSLSALSTNAPNPEASQPAPAPSIEDQP